MKTFLALLAAVVVGWFARDFVKVAWASGSHTATVQVQSPVSLSAVKPAPKPAQAKPAPVKGGETALDRQLRETGVEVSNSGYWRYNPVSRYDENHPGGAWASPFHGEPRDL